MNNISKSIQYAQWSWNPMSGCKHGCRYCYARRIAERLRPKLPEYGNAGDIVISHGQPFPKGFQPTFYPLRLSEPSMVRTPAIVFCGDMCDLWGDWVPKWVHDRVMDGITAAPQHIYLMLTKAPENYPDPDALPSNVWPGTTMESGDQLRRVEALADQYYVTGRLWVSCEPLQGPIAGDWVESVDWIVVGAETGPGARPPERAWVEDLVEECRRYEVPLFMKGNLARVWGQALIQEWPAAAKGHLPAARKER